MRNNFTSSKNQNITRCVNCIRSSARADVMLDSNGFCVECKKYLNESAPQSSLLMSTDSFREELVNRYPNSNSRYSCMALFSGGKDSTYMLSLLSDISQFRVLAVTIDHWFMSPSTENNIKKVIKNLKIDHLIFRPSWDLYEKIYRELISKTGKLCLACEAFLTTEIYRLSNEMQIPCMAWGLSKQQFQTPPEWLTKIDLNYWKKMNKRFIDSLGMELGLNSTLYKRFTEEYIPNILPKQLPDLLFPFLAIDYDPCIVEQKVKEIGWKRPKDVSGISSNCYGNHLHMYLKQQLYSRESLEDYLSLLVRNGEISRQLALHVIENKSKPENAQEILDIIGINQKVDDLAAGLIKLGCNMQ